MKKYLVTVRANRIAEVDVEVSAPDQAAADSAARNVAAGQGLDWVFIEARVTVARIKRVYASEPCAVYRALVGAKECEECGLSRSRHKPLVIE